jgi:hypothetical protein
MLTCEAETPGIPDVDILKHVRALTWSNSRARTRPCNNIICAHKAYTKCKSRYQKKGLPSPHLCIQDGTVKLSCSITPVQAIHLDSKEFSLTPDESVIL